MTMGAECAKGFLEPPRSREAKASARGRACATSRLPLIQIPEPLGNMQPLERTGEGHDRTARARRMPFAGLKTVEADNTPNAPRVGRPLSPRVPTPSGYAWTPRPTRKLFTLEYAARS